MYFPDLGTECGADRGPYVRAIGWLDGEHPFTRGTCSPDFIAALREHVASAWQPFAAAGMHERELCANARTAGNLWIPASDVVYVSPEMIVHYVEAHEYRPPDAFIQAVLAYPTQGSREYCDLMRRFPALWTGTLPA